MKHIATHWDRQLPPAMQGRNLINIDMLEQALNAGRVTPEEGWETLAPFFDEVRALGEAEILIPALEELPLSAGGDVPRPSAGRRPSLVQRARDRFMNITWRKVSQVMLKGVAFYLLADTLVNQIINKETPTIQFALTIFIAAAERLGFARWD